MSTDSSCPSPSEVLKILKSTYPIFSDEELNKLYTGMIEAGKEEQGGGTRKINQRGGVKCKTLHYYYGISVAILAAVAGLGFCFLSERKAELANHFVWYMKDIFDPRHYGHFFDIIGKLSSLGLGFLDKVTSFLQEFFKNPTEGGFTMNWVKNIFDIFCEVEEDKKTVAQAKIEISEVMGGAVKEYLKEEGINYEAPEPIDISNDTVVYDGKKELKILVGDTVITISPSVPLAPSYPIYNGVSSYPDEYQDQYPYRFRDQPKDSENWFKTAPGMYNYDDMKFQDYDKGIPKFGGKRIKIKTKTTRKTNKKTRSRKPTSRRSFKNK